jgi:hypothetical protein
MKIGYNQPLYILPFDHRSSFEKGLLGWTGTLSREQAVEDIAGRYMNWVQVFTATK